MLRAAHAGAMYSIARAEAPAAETLSAALAALRLLQEAEEVLGGAEGACSGLVADSTWRSDGVSAQALREALNALHRAVMTEAAALVQLQNGIRGALSA